jgi:hypothetical protein
VDEIGSLLARPEWNPETSEFTVLSSSGRIWKKVVRAVNQDRFAPAATRGYLVLQPQFRGSTGFSREFRLAG